VDIAILLLVWLSFATWLTLHVVLAIVVGKQKGTLFGLLGLLVVPLLPWFGFAIRAKWRSVAWLIVAVFYGVLLFLATR
jgi:hypothetical protein